LKDTLNVPHGARRIHIRPVQHVSLSSFPDSTYEYILGANHPDAWRSDICVPELDAFFVFEPGTVCVGKWLGRAGPAIRGKILEFLRTSLHGRAGRQLSATNAAATENLPVRYKGFYTGLHLETDAPGQLLRLVCHRFSTMSPIEPRVAPTSGRSACGKRPRIQCSVC